jgi:hypothetical protein
VRKINNLFKQTKVRIAFRSTNNIYDFTKPKINNSIEEYTNCGIYELTCATCKLYFVGQRSHSLKQRYQEHMRHTKQKDPRSAYALHTRTLNKHEYEPIINTMSLIKRVSEDPL